VLKPRRALPFFGRHPWVFEGAVHHVTGNPEPGAEVLLVTDRDEFVARGLYNPQSNIVVRLYSWDENAPLDEAFWSARLDEALQLRSQVLHYDDPQGACRLVYSESDGLSGMNVDRYGDWLLVQFTSLALATRRDLLMRLLKQKLSPAGIWLRTEKGIREAEGLALADGLLEGAEPPRPLFVTENGIRFGVDLVEGQKTGFFLDQRDNRAAAARYIESGRVLDLFCYTGGFALNIARRPEVREIVAADVSESALTLARANAELNGVAQKIHFHKADIFKYIETLHGAGERFNAVILDPPKLARHRKSVPEALRGYQRLNQFAVEMLEPNGILVTCSCTGYVEREMFESMLAAVSAETGRRIQILEARGQAPDHPTSATCLENNYLKCYICRVV
jgi:23S rRNA (cytosine1962-C5)-methyltransferase